MKSYKPYLLLYSSSSEERANPEQIPSKENIEQTKAMVGRQSDVSGQRKEVDVKVIQRLPL